MWDSTYWVVVSDSCGNSLSDTFNLVSYELNTAVYYDDITHIKPFTKITLENCYRMYGFENSKVEKFYQLPIVWKLPFLKYFLNLISFFIPLRSKFKLLRFSKELMLLGFATKN